MKESKDIGLNILMGPQYGSDSESSPTSQDKFSLHSVSLSVGDIDAWSIQSCDVGDRTDVIWSEDNFKPITQAMIDLVGISEGPFAEMVLNMLAQFGVFASTEKKSAQHLMRRLLLSGAFEKIHSMNGGHDCQVTQKDIHKVILEYFGEGNLFMPAYDYIKKFSLQEELDVDKDRFRIPTWTSLISSFGEMEDERSKRIIYDLSLKNLTLLGESVQNVQDLEFPAFLTMLFAPAGSLGDFLDCKADSDDQRKEIASFCRILSKFDLTPRQVALNLAQRYPYLKKILSEPEDTAVATAASTATTTTTTTTTDVSVYDLLSDNIPYDMSRLFMWQPENRLVVFTFFL